MPSTTPPTYYQPNTAPSLLPTLVLFLMPPASSTGSVFTPSWFHFPSPLPSCLSFCPKGTSSFYAAEEREQDYRTDYYYTGHNRPLGKAGGEGGAEEEGKRRSAGFGRGRRAGGGLRPISLSLFPLPTTNQPADGRRCLPLSSADCWFSGLWANSSGLERHPPPPPLLCTTTPSFPLAVAVESGRRKKRKPLSLSLPPSNRDWKALAACAEGRKSPF